MVTEPIPTTPDPDDPTLTTPPPAPAPAPALAPAPPPARPAGRYPAPIGWVIAAVILFWPTAIPALLASNRAARAAGAGDGVAAARESATAKRWGVVSVCVGAGLVVLSVVVSVLWTLLAVAVWHGHHGEEWGPGRGGWSNEQPFDRPGLGSSQNRSDDGSQGSTNERGQSRSDDGGSSSGSDGTRSGD